MRRRFGSVDSVVLPVPDRPKNSATSPSAPLLAEHREDPLLRQEISQQREHRLFDFAGIERAADENQFGGKIGNNEGFRVGAIDPHIGVKIRRVNNSIIRLVGAQAGSDPA